MTSVESVFSSISKSYHESYAESVVQPLLKKLEETKISTIWAATAFGAAVMLLLFYPSRSGKKSQAKRSKKKKKPTRSETSAGSKKELSLGEQIDAVHSKYEKDYKVGLENHLETFDPTSEQHDYQRKYYNEMLLKLLIELDAVDLIGVEGEEKKTLKEKRKQIIKKIQGDLKKLDALA